MRGIDTEETLPDFSCDASVTEWIQHLKSGDHEAVSRLWERYFGTVVAMARKQLLSSSRKIADEEDVASRVFQTLWTNASAGKFEQLQHRRDLWQLLFRITQNKVLHHRRRMAEKRNRFLSLDARPGLATASVVDVNAELAELLGVLLQSLEDPRLREIAIRTMQGETVELQAARCGVSEKTIRRKLNLIQKTWEHRVA